MTKKKSSSKKKINSKKKVSRRSKKSNDKATLWTKNIIAKLKQLESHGEEAIKTVYAKINKPAKNPNKRKQKKPAVFMTSYANLKTLPFAKKKAKPLNRFKLASIILAMTLCFGIFEGASLISNYFSSPQKTSKRTWVQQVSKKRIKVKRSKKLKKKRFYKKTAKVQTKSKRTKTKKRSKRRSKKRKRHVASKR